MDVSTPTNNQESNSGLLFVGQQLSERRLAQGLSQEQLADRMHLGIEQLAALESGDRDKLPEPVFIKAMVRRLSNHLELDADALVASLGSLSDGAVSNERVSQQKGPISPPLQPPSRPEKGAIWLWLVLIGATALGALAWVQRAALLELIQQPQSNSASATAKTTTTSNESITTTPETAPDTAIPTLLRTLLQTLLPKSHLFYRAPAKWNSQTQAPSRLRAKNPAGSHYAVRARSNLRESWRGNESSQARMKSRSMQDDQTC